MKRGRRLKTFVRPRFKNWGLEFKMEVDHSQVTIETVKKLIETAGKDVGLGTYRPAGKNVGPFGRFVIETFKQIS